MRRIKGGVEYGMGTGWTDGMGVSKKRKKEAVDLMIG